MSELDKRDGDVAVPADWTYAPAPESREIVQLRERYGFFVGGEWLEPTETYETISPASEEPLATVGQGTAEDVDHAVMAAREAYADGWSTLPGSERAKYLFRIARLLQERSREFAVLESLNGGKPIKESRDVDLPLAAAHFFYYAGWADKLEYAFPNRSPKPLGVAGQIIPWNFPLLMLAWKIAPALAAGNTVVLKPAETTPLTALLFCDVLRQAELPAGVVNIVTGDGLGAGAPLARHPGVNKISFTGSTEVGKLIGHASIDNMTRFTLELGGKSPVIVLDDCDPEVAAAGAANAIFFNHGQVCCAGSRLYVHKKMYERVVGEIGKIADRMTLGNGFDASAQMGPLVSQEQLDRVCSYIEAGRASGAEIVAGGERQPGAGYFVRPTVLANVSQNARVVQEEIFGPVLTALPYDSIEEVAAWANDSPYGLGASIWSNDLSKVHRLIPKIKAGTVWVNCHSALDPSMPFGGYKQSGIGRDLGRNALDAYLETKSVFIAV